jgi:hypothetical protein
LAAATAAAAPAGNVRRGTYCCCAVALVPVAEPAIHTLHTDVKGTEASMQQHWQLQLQQLAAATTGSCNN